MSVPVLFGLLLVKLVRKIKQSKSNVLYLFWQAIVIDTTLIFPGTFVNQIDFSKTFCYTAYDNRTVAL